MARYTGPKQKKARRFKEPIFGSSKALERKPYGPGQHGRSRFSKKSEYSVQLEQKQKAKYTYGLLEKQFRRICSENLTNFEDPAKQIGKGGRKVCVLPVTRM